LQEELDLKELNNTAVKISDRFSKLVQNNLVIIRTCEGKLRKYQKWRQIDNKTLRIEEQF